MDLPIFQINPVHKNWFDPFSFAAISFQSFHFRFPFKALDSQPPLGSVSQLGSNRNPALLCWASRSGGASIFERSSSWSKETVDNCDLLLDMLEIQVLFWHHSSSFTTHAGEIIWRAVGILLSRATGHDTGGRKRQCYGCLDAKMSTVLGFMIAT